MRFDNRQHAARLLARALTTSCQGARPLVLGVPRGGVPMARHIADALDGDLDVVLVHKLRAPGQPEFAIGAVDDRGHVIEGPFMAHVPRDYVQREIHDQRTLLQTRRAQYSRVAPPVDPRGRVVIVVDEGAATGASMEAAIHAVRAQAPRRLVVAIAVAPPEALARLRGLADEVVCLHSPALFGAVGEFFDDFSEVSDLEAIAALDRRGTDPAGGTTPPS